MAGVGAERPASTSSRKALVCGSSVASKEDSGELPARRRREEIAVGGPAVPARRGATRSLQNELPAHELAVVLAHRALGGGKARVGCEGALRPFPDIAEDAAAGAGDGGSSLVELVADHRVRGCCEVFPFRLGRQAG